MITVRVLLVVINFIAVVESGQARAPVARCQADRPPQNLPHPPRSAPRSDSRAAEWQRVGGEGLEQKTISATIRGQQTAITMQRYQATEQPSKGTVIYLCGGPGERCVVDGRPPSVPKGYTVVTLDYLGIHSNRAHGRRADSMSVEAQGDAVVSMVASLANESEFRDKGYTVYGHSFGTGVATDAVAKITAATSVLPRPKAVVLEGVLGYPLRQGYDVDAFKNIADTAWSRLSSQQQNAFLRAYDQTMGALSSSARADDRHMINDALSETLRGGPQAVIDGLGQFSGGSLAERLRWARDMTRGNESNVDKDRLYRAAGCQLELGRNGQSIPVPRFFGGRVPFTFLSQPNEDYVCDCPSVPRKWDPKDHQIRGVPIVYLNGEFDAVTPMRLARHHHDTQLEASERVFIPIPEGGHWETNEGRIASCTSTIFDAAHSGQIGSLNSQISRIGSGQCAADESHSIRSNN